MTLDQIDAIRTHIEHERSPGGDFADVPAWEQALLERCLVEDVDMLGEAGGQDD